MFCHGYTNNPWQIIYLVDFEMSNNIRKFATNIVCKI